MKRLTVLFDSSCRLCCRARRWLERQDAWVELEFVAAGSRWARERFPGLDHDGTRQELTVISDRGEVWTGEKAWLLCLWALKDQRERALAWSTPSRRGFARRLVAWISDHRYRLGGVEEPGSP